MSTPITGRFRKFSVSNFQIAPFLRLETPYYRPSSAPRNRGNMGSAQRLIPIVFRKSLSAPGTVPEADIEWTNVPMEAVSNNLFVAREPVVNRIDENNCSGKEEFGKLEWMLKNKTFSRAEVDRLTELLRLKTVDISAEGKKKISEPSTSQPVVDNKKVELANIPVHESGLDTRRLLGEASAVVKEEIASPVQLAKAYMDYRPSKVSSTGGLRSLREELPLRSNVPFTRKSSGKPPIPRSSVCFAGIPGASENGHQIPISRGRSAIHTMARTPYSRIHPTAKGIGNTDDWCSGPSTSPCTRENSIQKKVSSFASGSSCLTEMAPKISQQPNKVPSLPSTVAQPANNRLK